MSPTPTPPSDDDRDPTLLDVVRSVGAAFFGVQSSKNRRRDFTRGKPHQYVIIALLMTVALVLMFYGIVQLVLTLAVS